jgi:hypothetical protein
MMAKDDPITCAAKLKSNRRTVRDKFGVQVPRDVKEAYRLDTENKNTLWQEAIVKEFDLLREFQVYQDLGFKALPPRDHQRIMVHYVIDVKETGIRKARLVANGSMTQPPAESIYSGVVSLRSIRIAALLSELNDLNLFSADIASAFLMAKTSEKGYCLGGDGFGDLKGHTLVIPNAQAERASMRVSATHLRNSGSFRALPTPVDEGCRKCIRICLHVCGYIAGGLRDHAEFMKALRGPTFEYGLKGGEEPTYHLGGDFYRDNDGTLCWGAKTSTTKKCSTARERLMLTLRLARTITVNWTPQHF